MPFEDGIFQCVIGSPPYWGLRAYGDDPDEIGKNQSLDEYIEDLRLSCAEVWRVTDERAVFWLNVGDSAVGSGGAGGDYNVGGSKEGLPKYRQGYSGLRKMQLCLVPQRVALMAQEGGWMVRSAVVWDKGRIRRGDYNFRHTRRPGVQHETVLMLSKVGHHRFFADHLGDDKGDVWHFPPHTEHGHEHQAPFPIELPSRCIVLSTVIGDHVLDPWAGSGTTLRAAEALGRLGSGLDIYKTEPTEEDGTA